MATDERARGQGASSAVAESSREISGWRFVCHKAAAINSEQRECLATELCLGAGIPLPEIVFGDSSLRVEHPADGFSIHFDAAEALHVWLGSQRDAVATWKPSSFDYTYSTNYKGTVTQMASSVRTEPTEEKLPLDKLKQQVDILFYDRVDLFEDDIRDLGEIYLEVKVRAMEFGFLLLCRYYCRVDEKSVKLIDTRYYHEFGKDFLWRDHEVRQATMDKLKPLLDASPQEQAQEGARLDLSADVVYGLLQPAVSTTEKIRLPASS